MRKAPLVAVALALMAGMLAAHHLHSLPTAFWLVLAASGGLLAGLAFKLFRNKQLPALLGLLLLLGGIGGLLMHIADPQYDPQHWTNNCPEKAYLAVQTTETPLPRERSYRVKAKVIYVDNHPRRGDIMLYLRKDSIAATLQRGDKLLLHGYPDTLRGSIYITSDHYIVTQRDSTSLRARIEHARMVLLQRMQQGPLERKYAGIAEAMTLGWRGDIDPKMNMAFRDSGIVHLLCVSGLHVGLLAALIGGLFFWAGKARRGRILRGTAQLLALWGFALLTGLAPATVRAALMFSLFVISNTLARRTSSLNLLAAAAVIMLAAKPMLLFDVGWQLSFAAVAGILLAQPVIRVFRNWLWQTATVSIAATIASLPIVASTFHRLPLYFLIANVVIVPLAGLLLGLSLLYLIIPCTVTAWPLDLLLQFAEVLTGWVSSLPHAVVENIYLEPWAMAALIVAVLLLLAAPRQILRAA